MKTCPKCGGQLPDPADPLQTRPLCDCDDEVSWFQTVLPPDWYFTPEYLAAVEEALRKANNPA